MSHPKLNSLTHPRAKSHATRDRSLPIDTFTPPGADRVMLTQNLCDLKRLVCGLVISIALPVGLACISATSVQAEVPKRVVQNRRPVPTYEWTLGAGVLPLDAFKKGITAGGSLTIHRDHLWAWEALSAAYSFEYQTALEDELRAFKLQATPFERVKTFVTSNLVFKPLYWKGAWLNERMAYGELFFVAGGGYGWLSQTSRPVVNGGLGVKLLHENGLASRLDVRFLSFFNADDFHNELWVNLGLSL